ncbi:MAG: tetratricopeptide repeat protein [Verrucomicrobiales bacterium]
MSDSIERWQTALAANPNNHLARFSLAKALFDQENYADAKKHLALALAAKPDWMLVQILLGKSELALGNKAEAIRNFHGARRLAMDQNHESPLAELETLLEDLQA